MRANSITPIILGHLKSSIMLKRQSMSLGPASRIKKFVLFFFWTLLIILLFTKRWSNMKILFLKAYDGVPRMPLLTTYNEVAKAKKISNTRFFGLTLERESLDMDTDIQKECHLLENDIQMLKKQIKTFDKFVKENKELFKVCQDKLFSGYIIPAIEIPNLDLADPINFLTKLQMEKNNLEHLIAERKRFIMRHPEVETAFTKAVGIVEI